VGQVRVGTASWTDRTLIESGWYPPEADTPETRLRYYARQFALVEVDATYYARNARSRSPGFASDRRGEIDAGKLVAVRRLCAPASTALAVTSFMKGLIGR
jgi:Protein of unknown function DUF72